MTTNNLLDRLRQAGLTVAREGTQLTIIPRQRLTDDLRAAIHDAKAELLSALDAEHAHNHLRPQHLEARIRTMAQRWGYSSEELEDSLARATTDPKGWLLWTEQDERDFGGCITAEDFAARYVRLRGLA